MKRRKKKMPDLLKQRLVNGRAIVLFSKGSFKSIQQDEAGNLLVKRSA